MISNRSSYDIFAPGGHWHSGQVLVREAAQRLLLQLLKGYELFEQLWPGRQRLQALLELHMEAARVPQLRQELPLEAHEVTGAIGEGCEAVVQKAAQRLLRCHRRCNATKEFLQRNISRDLT